MTEPSDTQQRLITVASVLVILLGVRYSVLGLFSSMTFFGAQPTTGALVEQSQYFFVSGVVMALGLLGVWWARRTKPWLVAALVVFVVMGILSLGVVLSA